MYIGNLIRGKSLFVFRLYDSAAVARQMFPAKSLKVFNKVSSDTYHDRLDGTFAIQTYFYVSTYLYSEY